VARKQFTLNRTPHIAELGDDMELHFVPEVMGDEFLEGFVRLQQAYRSLGQGRSDEEMDAGQIRALVKDLRDFLHQLLVPESQQVFSRYVVLTPQAGDVLKEAGVYQSRAQADNAAEALPGATVRDESLQLPTRVLMELMEWAAELYGGADGARPTGSSNGSASPSRSRGARGTASSRSKG
jgi:hypothetical protein